MKFKPGFQSQLPKQDFLTRVKREPFLQLRNPSEKPLRPLEIPAASRFRHVYIAGASQFGKSTLLEHMITQDMENGEGLTLLDPKGDLAELVLARVPPHRKDRCIYIDIKNPIPINFMGWKTEEERQTLLADVNQTFMRFSAMAAGDQWGSILRWVIYTLLSAREVSFLDIYHFLSNDDRHNTILELVERNNVAGRYDDIIHYWAKVYPKIGKPREGPILTRMSTFITTPPLKKMLGPSSNPLEIFDCMESRKILIVNLMGVGRENGNLVGALLTSKIQQAAFRRQEQAKANRVPHFFYADEFQNFQTSDFDRILSEAGGFKLSLTLANQGLYQLDSQIKQSVFTNVNAARIAFHLNHEDVANWRHLLPKASNNGPIQREVKTIEPDELANLPPYHAFFKIGNEVGMIVATPPPLPPPTTQQLDNAKEIAQATLDNYPDTKSPSAESGKKRPGENTPSQPIPNVVQLENEGPTIGASGQPAARVPGNSNQRDRNRKNAG
jgi:hypothetical protein